VKQIKLIWSLIKTLLKPEFTSFIKTIDYVQIYNLPDRDDLIIRLGHLKPPEDGKNLAKDGVMYLRKVTSDLGLLPYTSGSEDQLTLTFIISDEMKAEMEKSLEGVEENG